MTAPAPSPAEQAVIDRFGIFEAEETVERVARAIAEAWYPDRMAIIDRASWEQFRDAARAAIAAMPRRR